MSRLSDIHQKTNEHGIGKCSVPMWSDGCPSGFCDAPAYGDKLPASKWLWGRLQYEGFVPGLACLGHGGPDSRVFMDGNSWVAVYPDFKNLQESPAGFGDSAEEARKNLKGSNVELRGCLISERITEK